MHINTQDLPRTFCAAAIGQMYGVLFARAASRLFLEPPWWTYPIAVGFVLVMTASWWLVFWLLRKEPA